MELLVTVTHLLAATLLNRGTSKITSRLNEGVVEGHGVGYGAWDGEGERRYDGGWIGWWMD